MLIGFTIFVSGSAGAAYVGARQSSGSTNKHPTVEVDYAAAPVPAGTAGAKALSEARIRTKGVDPATRPANAVSDPAQMAGRVAAVDIPTGAVITTDMFSAPQTRIGTVVIADGKRALAVEMQPVPGVAGFVGAGDRVDVYGVVKGDGTQHSVRLVLQGVEVLNVNGTGLPSAQGQPSSPNLIYLLALTPADAERVIYLSEFERVYFDLVPKGEAPVKTPGVGPSAAVAV